MAAQSACLTASSPEHAGPPHSFLAILYIVLFSAGLKPVTATGGAWPTEAAGTLPGILWIIHSCLAMPCGRKAVAETQAA